MNAGASAVLALAGAALLAAAALLWLARAAAVRDPRDHASTATSRATASRRSAPTPRRGWRATSSRSTCSARAPPSSRCRGCATRWCGGSGRTALRGARSRSTAPAALWAAASDGNDKLVNSYGEVFEANVGDVEDERLPTLRGPDGQLGAGAGDVPPARSRCSRRSTPRVDALQLSGRGSWQPSSTAAPSVELGRGSDDEVRGARRALRRAPAQVTARFQRPLEYADLRHADGYAVRLKGVTTTCRAPARSARNRSRRRQTHGQGIQGSRRRPRHRHRQGDGGGGRGACPTASCASPASAARRRTA